MASPFLKIRRLVVIGSLQCDIQFNNGLNIVEAIMNNGDPKTTNTSGKTTLVELIQYGLGGKTDARSFPLTAIRDEVQTLWLEIEVNSQILTIQRSLQALYSMAYIHESSYNPNLKTSPGEQVTIDELPNVILRGLEIPSMSVKKKDGSLDPLSFRLLMRAFILHQENSFGQILDKVQPEPRKKDIIGFLTKITPLDRYTIDDTLSEAQRERDELRNYYQMIQKYLVENQVPTLIEAEARVRNAREALETARQGQIALQMEIKEQAVNKRLEQQSMVG